MAKALLNSVLIIGMGGLGCRSQATSHRLESDNNSLDFDDVDESNLQRQIFIVTVSE